MMLVAAALLSLTAVSRADIPKARPTRAAAIKTEKGIWSSHYGPGKFEAGSIQYSQKTGVFNAVWQTKAGQAHPVSDTLGVARPLNR
jgi:hypothetical protein